MKKIYNIFRISKNIYTEHKDFLETIISVSKEEALKQISNKYDYKDENISVEEVEIDLKECNMKKNNCLYCIDGKERDLPFDTANSSFEFSLDEENYFSVVYSWDEYNDYAVYKPKFCPECGRNLQDKDDNNE